MVTTIIFINQILITYLQKNNVFLTIKYKMKTKMNAKNVLVSFLAIVTLVLLVSMVSADSLADDITVKVDGMVVGTFDSSGQNTSPLTVPSVIAGETAYVEVYFTALENDLDVTLEVELEGGKVDSEASSEYFDVENYAGNRYDQSVRLAVPFELRDEVSDDLVLEVEINGEDHSTELMKIPLRVQRPSYFPEIKSITFDSTVDAGETFPVDIVIKNMGYNDLNDLYITVSIPELGITKGPTYFEDLAPLETCASCTSDDCDEEDTVSGRLYLDVPYEVSEGTYTLKVEVKNDDVSLTESNPLFIENSLPDSVIVTNTDKSADVGENAEYTMLLVNPTNQLKVFKIMLNSDSGLYVSASETLVAVSAGSSETVRILANADEAGTYSFSATVLDGDTLLDTVAFSLEAEGDSSVVTNPIMVLTIVLAIVFIVLLIVLIVLIGKKPAKTEEFGESYY